MPALAVNHNITVWILFCDSCFNASGLILQFLKCALRSRASGVSHKQSVLNLQSLFIFTQVDADHYRTKCGLQSCKLNYFPEKKQQHNIFSLEREVKKVRCINKHAETHCLPHESVFNSHSIKVSLQEPVRLGTR